MVVLRESNRYIRTYVGTCIYSQRIKAELATWWRMSSIAWKEHNCSLNQKEERTAAANSLVVLRQGLLPRWCRVWSCCSNKRTYAHEQFFSCLPLHGVGRSVRGNKWVRNRIFGFFFCTSYDPGDTQLRLLLWSLLLLYTYVGTCQVVDERLRRGIKKQGCHFVGSIHTTAYHR